VDPVALAWIALAAVLHAAWNILLKGSDEPLRTAAIGVAAASVVLVPLVVLGWLAADRPAVPPAAWALGITSGGVEVLYFAFLAAAFRRGDLSVVYPLARGTAPLLAVVIAVLVLGERLEPAAWAGVALLIAGMLLVQRPWRLLRADGTSDDRAAAGFALLTGVTIATYTALDRVGVQQTTPWLYAGILWPTCMVGLAVLVLVRQRLPRAAGVPADEPVDRRLAVAGGFSRSRRTAGAGPLSRARSRSSRLRESAIVLTSLWGVVRLRGDGASRSACASAGP
jgi:uncharacterized membrane protein